MEDTYDQEDFYHDELERDCDEPYEPDDCDCDREEEQYEEQYEVEEF